MPSFLEDFKKLAIDGMSVSALSFDVGATVVIELAEASQAEGVLNIYILQFSQVPCCAIKVDAAPWFGNVVSHQAYCDSHFLLSSLNNFKSPTLRGNKYWHITIGLEQGRFDIVATDFTFSCVKKIPQGRPADLMQG